MVGREKKVILFGAVRSSNLVLDVLIRKGVTVEKVFSLDESVSQGVSGYYPIHKTAEKAGIECQKFIKINDPAILEQLKELAPDYIFVVGLSQLISKEFLKCAKEGVIGLHPAPLPKYRGRAAMVWQMLLKETQSAVTLFFIDEGMDSGDIIVQEPFLIGENDYAIDVDEKGLRAVEGAMEKVADMLLKGKIDRMPQDHSKATYLLKRGPEDGEIDWTDSVEEIQRLVRAVSKPYPGAFSYYDGRFKLIIWKADKLKNTKYIGTNGQICEITQDYFDIVCKDGLLRVYSYEVEGDNSLEFKRLVVGHKLKKRGV